MWWSCKFYHDNNQFDIISIYLYLIPIFLTTIVLPTTYHLFKSTNAGYDLEFADESRISDFQVLFHGMWWFLQPYSMHPNALAKFSDRTKGDHLRWRIVERLKVQNTIWYLGYSNYRYFMYISSCDSSRRLSLQEPFNWIRKYSLSVQICYTIFALLDITYSILSYLSYLITIL